MLSTAMKCLTLLSVLFHAAVGCCAHHDHPVAWHAVPHAVELQESVPVDSGHCSDHSHLSVEHSSVAVAVSVLLSENDPLNPDSCPDQQHHCCCCNCCLWLTTNKVEVPGDDGPGLPVFLVDAGLMPTLSAALISSRFERCPPQYAGRTDVLRASIQIWRL